MRVLIRSSAMQCDAGVCPRMNWLGTAIYDLTHCSYEFPADGVDEAYLLSRDKFNIPDYAILAPCLIKTEITYSVAMKWINKNAKEIRTLLNSYNVDPDYGLVLVLTQYSAPSYCRVVVPSNLAEEGVVLGLSNGSNWVEPENAPRTLTMIDHHEVYPQAPSVSHYAGDRLNVICAWVIN